MIWTHKTLAFVGTADFVFGNMVSWILSECPYLTEATRDAFDGTTGQVRLKHTEHDGGLDFTVFSTTQFTCPGILHNRGAYRPPAYGTDLGDGTLHLGYTDDGFVAVWLVNASNTIVNYGTCCTLYDMTTGNTVPAIAGWYEGKNVNFPAGSVPCPMYVRDSSYANFIELSVIPDDSVFTDLANGIHSSDGKQLCFMFPVVFAAANAGYGPLHYKNDLLKRVVLSDGTNFSSASYVIHTSEGDFVCVGVNSLSKHKNFALQIG